MSTLRLFLGSATIAAFASGCAKGKDPPEATRAIRIEGGTFTMGASQIDPCNASRIKSDRTIVVSCSPTEQSALARHEVEVQPFCIDQHEVTVLQFRHCVERDECSKPKSTNAGNTNTPGYVEKYYTKPDKYAAFPVLGVDWDDAKQYCASKGGRLPTEIEWEFTATSRGTRTTVWDDDQLDADLESGDCEANINQLGFGACSDQQVRAVTTSPKDKTAQGIFDIAANAAEWVADDFDYLAYCADDQNGTPLDTAFVIDEQLKRPVYGKDDNGDDVLPAPLLSGSETCLKNPARNNTYAGGCDDIASRCQSVCASGYATGQGSEQRLNWQRAECAARQINAETSRPGVRAYDQATPNNCVADMHCSATPDGDETSCAAFCDCLTSPTADSAFYATVSEPPVDGAACIRQCNTSFEMCARDDCLREDASVACLREGDTRRPAAWCIGRSGVDSTAPVKTPASRLIPDLQGAKVVRGADFQQTVACRTRPTRRGFRASSSPLVGFRCVYDTGSERCK